MIALITPGVRIKLYRFALRITKQPGAAESLLADSISKAAQMVDVSRITKFVSYVKAVLRNKALDWLKKWKSQRTYLESHRDVTTRSAFAEAISREAMKMFDECVSRLTRRERRTVLLRVIDLLSFEEIGKKTKVTTLTARMTFFRAKGKLREWYRYVKAQ